MRVSLIGPSGAGKTTTAQLMQKMLPGSVICSIATPLNEIQHEFYRRLHIPSPYLSGSQDGEMLQKIRDIFLSRSESFLSDEFHKVINSFPDNLSIINDDCRLSMHKKLFNMGFVFVWIEGAHREKRSDKFKANGTSNINDTIIQKEHCLFTINNNGDISNLLANIKLFLKNKERFDG
ncbi:MAG: hypothetical protein QTN59_11400 [Candidatus Electrothrix communis]|nr:MAG: hypothetical protein QTN59_11400 [Candidatus Electrothrix communis]